MITISRSQLRHDASHRNPVRTVIDGTASVLGLVSAGIVVVLMLGIVLDVAWAALGGAGVRGLVEYGEIAMVAIVFLSIAQAQRTDSHVAVDILVERLEPRIAMVLRAAVLVGMCLLMLWLTRETWVAATLAYEVKEARFGLVHVPIWPARFTLPVGFFAMALQCGLQALDAVQALRGDTTDNPDQQRADQGGPA